MAPLTERQLQVIGLVADAATNRRISQETGLALSTVQEYMRRIARKLPGEGPPRYKILRWYFTQSNPTPQKVSAKT